MSEEKEEAVFETEEENTEEEKKVTPVAEEKKEETKTEEKPEEENKIPFSDGIDHSAEKQWYVANTYSGRERVVADYLEKRKVSMHMQDNIFRIVVVEQEEIVNDKDGKPILKKNGEVKKKTINLYPGYIFVEAIMSDLAWYVIRNTPGVTGLVGSSGSGTKPYPLTREEMVPILKQMNLIVPEVRGDYAVDDKVRITEGSFADAEGTITSIDSREQIAKVAITFFGRVTEVDVAYSSLEKVEE